MPLTANFLIRLRSTMTKIVLDVSVTVSLKPVRRSLNQVTLKRSLGDHYCGGSIINYNKVISAAHCKQPNNNWSASAGSVTLNAQLQQIAGSSQVKTDGPPSSGLLYDFSCPIHNTIHNHSTTII